MIFKKLSKELTWFASLSSTGDEREGAEMNFSGKKKGKEKTSKLMFNCACPILNNQLNSSCFGDWSVDPISAIQM